MVEGEPTNTYSLGQGQFSSRFGPSASLVCSFSSGDATLMVTHTCMKRHELDAVYK